MKTLFYTFVFLWLFTSCAKENGEANLQGGAAQPILLSAESREILNQGQNFSMNLFKTVASHSGTQNLFISPYNMAEALSVLYNGADGATRAEIASVLGLENGTVLDVNQYYQSLTTALLLADPNTKLSLSNAIWANKGYSFKQSFTETIQKYYGAEADLLDFSQASSLQRINDWGKEKTNGAIPKMMDTMEDPSRIMAILMGAVYFDGRWSAHFDKNLTNKQIFHNANGAKPQVSMMHIQKSFYCLLGERFSKLTMPYGNGTFQMEVLLPNEGEDLDAIINDMDMEAWNTEYTMGGPANVTLSMPRFQLNSETNMLQILQLMGVSSAFTPGAAEFKNMFTEGQAYISQCKQKSCIDVMESGTVAASLSLSEMKAGAISLITGPVAFTVNRPFVFAISEQSTGAILFMGKVANL